MQIPHGAAKRWAVRCELRGKGPPGSQAGLRSGHLGGHWAVPYTEWTEVGAGKACEGDRFVPAELSFALPSLLPQLMTFPCNLLHFGAKTLLFAAFGAKISDLRAICCIFELRSFICMCIWLLAFGFWLRLHWLLLLAFGFWHWFHLAFGFWLLLAFGFGFTWLWAFGIGFTWRLAFGLWLLLAFGFGFTWLWAFGFGFTWLLAFGFGFTWLWAFGFGFCWLLAFGFTLLLYFIRTSVETMCSIVVCI
eukprot:s87_g2.t1